MLNVLTPCLLDPKHDDGKVDATDDRIIALHRGDNRTVSEISMFHFALDRLFLLRVGYSLESLAIDIADDRN